MSGLSNGLRVGSWGLILPVLACFAVGATIFFLGNYLGWRGFDPSNTRTYLWAFSQFDGKHYEEIVATGYKYDPSQRSMLAFFPVYPMIANAVVSATDVRPIVALLIVSHLFLAAALVVLAIYLRMRRGNGAATAPSPPFDKLTAGAPSPIKGEGEIGRPAAELLGECQDSSEWRAYSLLAFAFAPCALFFHLAIAESCFVFIMLLCFLAFERRWPLVSVALLVGLCTATRPVGIAFVLPFLWHLRIRSANWRQFFGRSALLVPLSCWGLLAYMAYQYAEFGSPIIFATTQDYWRRYPALPLGEKILALASGESIWMVYVPGTPGFWKTFGDQNIPIFNLQFMNPIYFVGTAALVAIGACNRWLTKYEVLASIPLLAIPYITRGYDNAMLSHARFAAAVIPAYIVVGHLLAKLPREVAIALLCISAFLMGIYTAEHAMGRAFY